MNNNTKPDKELGYDKEKIQKTINNFGKKDKGGFLKSFGLFTQIGVSMAVCIFFGVILGKYLDEWLGTSPWMLLVCAMAGGAAAIKIIYDIAVKERG